MRSPALVLVLLFGAAVSGACQEPDPNFGDPNGIIGKKLPNEQATAPAGAAVDVPAPTVVASDAHKTKMQAPPAGDCLVCHGAGPTPPKFSFGGRVEDKGAGVADVVVTVTGLTPVKTDKDGFFWLAGADLPAGKNVQVSKGATSQKMGGQLDAKTGGGCGAAGTCHSGSTSPVHL